MPSPLDRRHRVQPAIVLQGGGVGVHQEDGTIDALVVMLKVEGVAPCRALTLSKVCGAMYHLHVAACQMQVRIYVINVVPSIVVCGTGWRMGPDRELRMRVLWYRGLCCIRQGVQHALCLALGLYENVLVYSCFWHNSFRRPGICMLD